MASPSQRPIKRLLVANRGEIAARVLCAARELEIETFALYTTGDASHTTNADHAVEVKSTSSYMDIAEIITIVEENKVDAVHPGYGFLSESEEFARRVEETGAFVIGPGPAILRRTGNKLTARRLAEECQVPVCPGLQSATSEISTIRDFARTVGYPIMIKAVDGGGGRGIRIINREADIGPGVKRATEESPSHQVFAEKAAINGFHHIEIQVIGDGKGGVCHLWERDCSIQRRYQKIIEVAPSNFRNRRLIAKVIQDALRMARRINYLSLGTFEFLVNERSEEYYFLEINPRLQVEHTITECISHIDLVRTQILVAQGYSLASAGLLPLEFSPENPPYLHSIQLRITAENVDTDWSLSIGRIQSFHFPSGNGIRVDTHLTNGYPAVVSTDFDSLLAKVIVTGSSWEAVARKAIVALEGTQILGVTTNINILKGIVSHPEFINGKCDTQWLERFQPAILKLGNKLPQRKPVSSPFQQFQAPPTVSGTTGGAVLLRRGDAWSVELSTPSQSLNQLHSPGYLKLTRVLRNEFPTSLAAEIEFAAPISSTQPNAPPTPYTLTLKSTTASSSAISSTHRRGNPQDLNHVTIPFPGKLVEVLVEEGDVIQDGDVVCIVQQMKMELEVRAKRGGTISWVTEAEAGEDIAEGTLACTIRTDMSDRAAKL